MGTPSSLSSPASCSTRPRGARRALLAAVVTVWLAAVGTGMAALWDHDSAPGIALPPPGRWPARSAIERAPGLPTLVVFSHPHCPCTRASLEDLARLMGRAHGRLRAHLLFVQAAGAASARATELWRTATAIPGVMVAEDHDGREARRFRAATSGYALLYDDHGALRFSGGITGSRGHTGDNLGRSAVAAFLDDVLPADERSPVFGCALFADDDRGSPEEQDG